jgi:hypothetical protein
MIPYPLPELLDRMSICKLKMERIGEPQCFEEFQFLEKGIKEYNFTESDYYFKLLYETNAKIWDMESDIRKGMDDKLGLEEIGRRAIKIRETNKIRVSIKNELSKKSKSGFEDIKINHISQTDKENTNI